MTTSRVIRGTRAKVFLYVCAILIIVGIIACYNNTLSQLEEVKKSNDICHQQEENLSTQLQVISDYKQRLEKSLKTEQFDHQQIKANLDNQLKEERSKYEKDSSDMKLKLGSLQQHFNLLQTQYDDYKEETSKTQKQEQEEINNLEARISELLEEQKKIKSSKDNLKAQCEVIERDKEHLELQMQEHLNKKDDEKIGQLKKENEELKSEISRLKAKCGPEDTLLEPKESQNQNPLNKDNNQNNDKQDLPVLPEPNQEPFKIPSSSSTSSNKVGPKPSQASLGVAKPIYRPTATPETVPKDNNKLPDGVVAIPAKKEEEFVNARYQNAKESAQNEQNLAQKEQNQAQKPKEAKNDSEKENGAHEQFDDPLFHDGLQFNDNDQMKQGEKPNLDKRHIDTMGKDKKIYDQDQGEYKEMNDVQLEENDDDDADGYDDHLARQKEPAVRN
ncbi:unnamed protein product [Psylliodes chrysocephalus]|uniref:Golgi integral membrane protein 4 n=1 Tax=Psylliodes chrysocephalus TaxID=3402493 RepID=A0A9P0G8A9_9CUCU|nr:unnamed protein product [Psylliodes chrysocephala]